MSTRKMAGQVRADLQLNKIIVELDRFGKTPPKVEFHGEILTTPSSVGRMSEVVIRTRHLGALGEAWIMEMRDAFAADAPASKKVGSA